MSVTPPSPLPDSSLSLFALLPAINHTNQPTANTPQNSTRPSPLTSRQSSSTIPTFKSLHSPSSFTKSGEQDPSADIDSVIVPARRLSLAPGLGTGVQSRTHESCSTLETVPASPKVDLEEGVGPRDTTIPAESRVDLNSPAPASAAAGPSSSLTTSKPPAFGLRSAASGSRSRRRPQTSGPHPGSSGPSSATMPSRGSLAVSTGGDLIRGSRTRSGWEGDEIVSVLRSSGLEGMSKGQRISSVSSTISRYHQRGRGNTSRRFTTTTFVCPTTALPVLPAISSRSGRWSRRERMGDG
ncbi:hypothetical protein DB88DRAFT_227824 [Papiliotrema laurentii]|uniref:Uncharacterized protein n=1 Tax=Papiliotrema laurentii TaxID=5418 RepID=A0AAD9FR46_PAPLA|nr:hypothetical protein DB88DRAFT_227824 [Papiliotrema laurentii]